MNNINFKIISRCYEKNMFKIVMMIQKAWYHPLVLLGTQCLHCQQNALITGKNKLCYLLQKGKSAIFIRNRLLHPSSRKEELDFNYIRLFSPDKSELNFCFEDDHYFVVAINRDKIVQQLSFYIIEAMLHYFIAWNKLFFALNTFITHQINKLSVEDWKLLTLKLWWWKKLMTLQLIITVRKYGLIFIHKMMLGMTQIFSFYVHAFHIFIIDWCNEKFNFWPTDISFSSGEDKLLEEEVLKKGFKRFNQTCLVLYFMA